MTSSLFTNTVHVCFDSVLAMDNPSMVLIFEDLMESRLKGFLGCPAVLCEATLVEFFENASVRDGVVISTVGVKQVEISEELFASSFELPVDGLTELSDVPKDIDFDARIIFSLPGEQVSISGKKQEMKIEFQFLSDILAKTIFVKAGSFDAVTHERFLMMAAINGGVKINWIRLLFNIFKDMVTPGSKQAKGYAIQICLLLKNVPHLALGDSKEFPASKILIEKTVHQYIAVVDKNCGRYRQSGPRPEPRLLHQPALEALTNYARTDYPRKTRPERFPTKRRRRRAAHGGGVSTCVTLNGSGIQLAVGPQPLWLRNQNPGLAQQIMVKHLATLPHDPLGITDSACKNQSVMVSVQYGPFNPYIPIRSTTIGKSRVAKDPIAMHTSWRSNSDIASVTRTNQYNQDLGLIHSTNGNHLESPKEGSSIDHQVTIYLHAQNITMFPTNETWYFASQILVSNSGGLILILTVQSTKNMFRIHNDY
ncbi:hypothetical protein F511_25613 [Dorcoceras hygrometricum]|uniref:Dystroglycan-like n=1 Tax=Dorcoceras hygrometricum TaxID=472368 RepID=A0A2Z7C423_9LAMI|nr:hypothetical protein F511_25613 [Dorcoceras hygrometricum]